MWAQDLLAGLNPYQGTPEPQKYWGALRIGRGCGWVHPSLTVTHRCCSCSLLHSAWHLPGSWSVVEIGLAAVNRLITTLGLLAEFSSVLGCELFM